MQQTLIFPLLLLAGVLLPLEGAPGWLQVASDLNPLTYIVEAERALFAGQYPADTVLAGFVAAAASPRPRAWCRPAGDEAAPAKLSGAGARSTASVTGCVSSWRVSCALPGLGADLEHGPGRPPAPARRR